MKPSALFTPLPITLSLLLAAYTHTAHSHSAGAVLDPAGNNPSFTALAEITCFNDGNGDPDHLFADVQDLSSPFPDLLVNVQLYKGNQAINITDPYSGDGAPSPAIKLQGGAGVYRILVNKTGLGPRAFEVTWHCETADGTHTGTDIVVRQFE
ncbi:MAG: hypothetical protein Kow0065_20520 [Methylomicrobium sp.]